MIEHVVTYKDFKKNPVTETLYFHVTQAEMVKSFLTEDGGFVERWKRVLTKENKVSFIQLFDDMVQMSVGVLNENGRFVKPKGYADEFIATEAYSAMFMDVMGDLTKAANFFTALFPEELIAQAKAQITADPKAAAEKVGVAPEILESQLKAWEELTAGDISAVETAVVVAEKPLEEYTSTELFEMPKEQFERLVGKDPNKMKREHMVIAMQRYGAGR